ncbi:MAG: PriCT-2 domain-containing protein [Candidatus Aenigmarchaeota archaeon]|nr:PriCT-2 domain-containing protein [Candidatus Aenigmarchaeota archaeon]
MENLYVPNGETATNKEVKNIQHIGVDMHHVGVDMRHINKLAQKDTSKSLKKLAVFWAKVSPFMTGKGNPTTNIIDQENRRTYALPNGEIGQLVDILMECQKEDVMTHISERQGDNNCIMLDFDIIQTSPERKITQLDYFKLCGAIREKLFEYIDFTPDVNFLIGIIQKREIQSIQNENGVSYKDGFHVLIMTRASKRFRLFFQKQLLESGIIKQIFGKIPVVGEINSILDLNSASVPTFFLGSSKLEKDSYKLDYVYEVRIDNNFNLSAPMPPNVYARHNMVAELSLNFPAKEIILNVDGQKTTLQPLGPKIAFPLKAGIADELQTIPQENVDDEADDTISIASLSVQNPEINLTKEMLDILPPEYASDRNLWRNVIFALANMGVDGKELGRWFSKKCPEKYDDEEFEKLWESTRGKREGGLTKASIFYWAKKADPEKYDAINSGHYLRVLSEYAYEYNGKIEDYMVAKLLFSMLGKKFVTDCRPNSKHEWYEFVLPGDNMKKGEIFKWRQEPIPDDIHIYISDCIPKVYSKLIPFIREGLDNAVEENHIKYYKSMLINLKKSTMSLFRNPFKNSIIDQAKYLFRRRGFADELDCTEGIFGVGNGVLQIGKKCKLIDYYHEFYISRFTKVHFHPYNADNKYVIELQQIIKEIIPEDDAYEFIMMYLSTSLSNHTKASLMLFLTGGGSNGKSLLLELMKNTLGDTYGKKLPLSLLTGKREASEHANAAFMELKDGQYGYFSEPERMEEINIGRFKEITGGESLSGRSLFKNQEIFKPKISLVSAGNHDFVIKTTDYGFWRRYIKYVCRVRFIENPDVNNPFEKKINRSILSKYVNNNNYLEGFLSILVHFYEKLQNEYDGNIFLVPKPTMDRETEAFRNECDTVNRFITERIVYSEGAFIPIDDISSEYQLWHRKYISKEIDSKLAECNSLLRNSKLDKFIIDNGVGHIHLKDYRALNDNHPDLKEGEYYLCGQNAPATPVAPIVPATPVALIVPATPVAPIVPAIPITHDDNIDSEEDEMEYLNTLVNAILD